MNEILSTIDPTAIIEQADFIKNSVIKERVVLYHNAKIKDSFLGEKSTIGDFSRITSSELLGYNRVDRNSLIYHSLVDVCTYFGSNNVVLHSEIGKYCSVSWGVTIGPANHDYKKLSTSDFFYNDYYDIKPKEEDAAYNRFDKKTFIGNDVWIGTNVTILNGLRIGNGVVIGANSIVTKDIPDYAIVAGNPAKVIKFRFEQSIITDLLELQWWNYPIDILKSNYDTLKSNDISYIVKMIKNLKK